MALRGMGLVARRSDLIAAGCSDRELTSAVRAGRISRIRHGWYGVPELAEPARRSIRVGGVITGVEALRLRGLYLPRRPRMDVAVPRNASHLRAPSHAGRPFGSNAEVRIHWVDAPRGALDARRALASELDALLIVLKHEARDIAVACCDGLIRYCGWSDADLDDAFARSPTRCSAWRALVDGRSDSWGETVVRLRLADAGIPFEPQSVVPGVGRFDGRVSRRIYVEVDGAQHDESWAGPEPSSFERDHLKDLGLALHSAVTVRITYAMVERRWDEVVAAIRTLIAWDEGTLG